MACKKLPTMFQNLHFANLKDLKKLIKYNDPLNLKKELDELEGQK
jgi:hypothetical protein